MSETECPECGQLLGAKMEQHIIKKHQEEWLRKRDQAIIERALLESQLAAEREKVKKMWNILEEVRCEFRIEGELAGQIVRLLKETEE
jgi:hypothetical protein